MTFARVSATCAFHNPRASREIREQLLLGSHCRPLHFPNELLTETGSQKYPEITTRNQKQSEATTCSQKPQEGQRPEARSRQKPDAHQTPDAGNQKPDARGRKPEAGRSWRRQKPDTSRHRTHHNPHRSCEQTTRFECGNKSPLLPVRCKIQGEKKRRTL